MKIHPKRRILFLLALFLSLNSIGQSVDIVRRGSFTPGELALLPEYCANAQGRPGYEGPQGNHWRSLMGKDFAHVHHYCRGLRDAFFAKTAQVSKATRNFLWERAIAEYDYMLRNCQPSMPLLPEILVRKAEAQLMISQISGAYQSLENSRTLKPDYWPAYTIWADQLISAQKFREASELLEQGLAHAPGNQEIQRRLDQLKRSGTSAPTN